MAACTGLRSGSECAFQCLHGYFATGSLRCQFGAFSQPRCHVTGYLGAVDVSLSEDFLTGARSLDARAAWRAPAWHLERVWRDFNQTLADPVEAFRYPIRQNGYTSVVRGGAPLDLPALFAGPTGGTLSFSWRVRPSSVRGVLSFFINGKRRHLTSTPDGGSSEWSRAKVPLSEGVHVCTWHHSGAVATVWVGDVVGENVVLTGVYQVGVADLSVDGVAMRSNPSRWSTSSDSVAWRRVITLTPRGETGSVFEAGTRHTLQDKPNASSQASGVAQMPSWIGNAPHVRDQARVTDLTVNAVSVDSPDGSVSFYYSLASERGFDALHFLVDGVAQLANGFPQSTGDGRGWRRASFRLPRGRHTLTWRFSLDWRGSEKSMARVTEILVRNAQVSPISFSETVRFTHISGNLEGAKPLLRATVGRVFRVPTDTVTASISQADAPGSGSSSERRLVDGVPQSNSEDNANIYSFYDVRIGVSCTSSSACQNISMTMQLIDEEPETLVGPVRAALGQPLAQVLQTVISRTVDGNPSPGWSASSADRLPTLSDDLHVRGSQRGAELRTDVLGISIAGCAAFVTFICVGVCCCFLCGRPRSGECSSDYHWITCHSDGEGSSAPASGRVPGLGSASEREFLPTSAPSWAEEGGVESENE